MTSFCFNDSVLTRSVECLFSSDIEMLKPSSRAAIKTYRGKHIAKHLTLDHPQDLESSLQEMCDKETTLSDRKSVSDIIRNSLSSSRGGRDDL